MTNTENLSSAARSALINAGVSRRGATVARTGMAPAVITELFHAGLVGANGGLTDRGVTARDSLVAKAMDF